MRNVINYYYCYRYLDHNQFVGCLPKELSLLTNLVYLYLSKNELHGTLPLEYTSFTNLRNL